MSIDTWLEQKLRSWQELREDGEEASANELCADDAEAQARPELRDELQQAIVRLKQHEGLFGQLHQEPSGTSTVLQRDFAPEQRQLHETNPTQSTIDQRAVLPPGAAHEIATPETIGRYRIDGVLGQGGFGRVFLAYDAQLQRRVAIKVPHVRLVSRPEHAEPYLKEARTAAELDHPNIAPVHDVGSTDQFPFFVVSKFIDGSNLAERIKKEARPPHRKSAELVATVAEALHYVHRRGLVHRDVKPANILIDAEGTPYVVDFGLALKEHELGGDAAFAGTPAYMSPEQARGEGRRVDGRTDIFSLGVVFYELLTGYHPFRKASLDALLEQITQVEVRPPRQRDDTIPKELERICLKALAKRATNRYTTARDMAEDLRHFLEQPDDAQAPTSTDARKRSRLVVAGAVMVLALIVLGVLALVYRPWRHEPGLQNLVQLHRNTRVFPVDQFAQALPTETGDQLRIRCEVPLDMQPVLFHLDSHGYFKVVAQGDLTIRSGEQSATVVYPNMGTIPLDDQVGTELFLVCAAPEMESMRNKVRALLEGFLEQHPLPAEIPKHAMVVMHRDGVGIRSEVTPRGGGERQWNALSELEDRLDELRGRLREMLPFFVGVAFPHVKQAGG